MELFEQLHQFRSSLRQQIVASRPKSSIRNSVLKLKNENDVLSNRKSTLQHHRSSTLISNFKDTDKYIDNNNTNTNTKYTDTNTKYTENRYTEHTNSKKENLNNPSKDLMGSTQITRLTDSLLDTSEQQFNRLSPQYVEQLLKLSSVIMYKVKNSKFYS